MGTADERARKKTTMTYRMLFATTLCMWVTTSHAEMGFDQRYERDYNIFNPVTQYQADNPLHPANAYDPDSAFNPVNRYDPGNPANPINQYSPNNLFNPVNQYYSGNSDGVSPRATITILLTQASGSHEVRFGRSAESGKSVQPHRAVCAAG
jgi:hypothetical protein